jgi:hypothetical protein
MVANCRFWAYASKKTSPLPTPPTNTARYADGNGGMSSGAAIRGPEGHLFPRAVVEEGEEMERVDERGVTKRLDLNELDVPDWAELALDEVERRQLLQRIAL